LLGSDGQRSISSISTILLGSGTPPQHQEDSHMGRGILLWMLGVPIPVILLLAMCSHH
jgi:hypothetical protein